MASLNGLISLIGFYLCLIMFFWNFNSFTFQERVIVMLIFTGFQCLSLICDKET